MGGSLPENSLAIVFAKDASGSILPYGEALDAVPVRQGYAFKGWSLTPYGEPLTPETPIAEMRDHTLYAVWTQE